MSRHFYPRELAPEDDEYKGLFKSICSLFPDSGNLVSIYSSRPGFADLHFSSTNRPRYMKRICYCEQCFEIIKLMDYMVTQDVWRKYCQDHFILCLNCLQENMDRNLQIEDFPDVIANAEIRYGYNMAVKHLNKEK